MKHFFWVLFLIATSCGYAVSDEWFPYYFPAEPAKAPDYMGMQASTFNAGKDVLDPPAGKHGLVKVKDGHFYFEDGTRARFWGTNLCFDACFPGHKQAEIMANRITYFGFNAVRLCQMDMFFEPNGIFEDVAPTHKNKQMKPTGRLSPRQLEKLDYLIYQLKQRGVYINMNTLVSRSFTEADGVIDAEKLARAAKPYSLFDRKLIELQKQYAKDLLTHLNPYTKLRYCDDPAICFVEITNENTIVELNRSSLPRYYQDELNGLFTKWLTDKYGSVERVHKLWQPKKNLTDDLFKWSLEEHEGEDTKDFLASLEEKYLKEMKDYLHNEIGVKCPVGIGGHWNPVQLKLQAACLDYIDKHAYWDHPKFPHNAWDINDFRIHNKSILTDKDRGLIGSLLRTKNQEPNMPFVVSEWNHCYPNKYAYETPVLLAQEAVKSDWDGLFQFAWEESIKGLPNYDNINSYFNISSNAQQLILCSFGSRIFLGNASYTVIPAQGGIQIIIASRDGAKQTIFVGEVKNTGSGWDRSRRFDWGTSPTLMRKQ